MAGSSPAMTMVRFRRVCMISRPVRVRVVLCGLAASPKGRRGADQAARAAASGKAGPPQPADPTRPAPRRQAPGLALRQDQDRSVPPCLKRSRAALPGAGRARPAPLGAGASRRAPPGRAPEPRPAPCEGDGQRRIHLSRKLAPAPAQTHQPRPAMPLPVTTPRERAPRERDGALTRTEQEQCQEIMTNFLSEFVERSPRTRLKSRLRPYRPFRAFA